MSSSSLWREAEGGVAGGVVVGATAGAVAGAAGVVVDVVAAAYETPAFREEPVGTVGSGIGP